MNLCKDCRHYTPPHAGKAGPTPAMCSHPAVAHTSPVDGHTRPMPCVWGRAPDQACGLGGAFWEAKE